jgi:hypothetical protein
MRFVWLVHSLRNARSDLTHSAVLDTVFLNNVQLQPQQQGQEWYS